MRDQVLKITAGDYELELCPAVGGCITAFRHRGRDVMRPATDDYWQNREPRSASSFPLVPFSNRIADGRAVFEGEIYEFPINMPPGPHTIHGDGWRVPWTVAEQKPDRITVTHAPNDTPFAYAARQIFSLTEEGLEASLALTNNGDKRIPAGFGHHPYFPRSEGLTLTMPKSYVWMQDERKLPVEKAPVPDAWNFASPQRLAPLDLDHDFTGGPNDIEMYWPETGMRLTLTPDPIFAHTVVFVPRGRDYVCVEPVTHLANAVNLAEAGRRDTGLKVLNPGETLAGSMWFRILG